MSFPYGSGQIPVSYDMAPTGRPKADLVQEHDINHSIWIYRMNHCIHLDMA